MSNLPDAAYIRNLRNTGYRDGKDPTYPVYATDIWFTPLFSDGIWYGRRLAAQMDLLISGSSRKSPENVNSFTEKPEKVADSPAKDTKKPCSFTEPAKAAAPVSTPVSTKKVETWKPAELNETKNGQLTFF